MAYIVFAWRACIDRFFATERPESEETSAALLKKLTFSLPPKLAPLCGFAALVFTSLAFEKIELVGLVISTVFGVFLGALLGLFLGFPVMVTLSFLKRSLQGPDTAKKHCIPRMALPVGLIIGFFCTLIPLAIRMNQVHQV